MALGIMAQRLKVAHALHGIGDGFLVENPPVIQGNVHAEALEHQTSKNFQLHPAHDLHVNLPILP